MTCRGVRASRKRVVQTTGAGPSTPNPVVSRKSTRGSADPPSVKIAREWSHSDVFQDPHKGRGYYPQNLAKLLRAVVQNPNIHIAKLQNLQHPDNHDPASEAIRALADGLPASNIIAANLGE